MGALSRQPCVGGTRVAQPRVAGGSRSELLRLFVHERSDPGPFHEGLAARSVQQIPFQISGKSILDLGSGPGFYSAALMRAGGAVTSCDLELANLAGGPVSGPKFVGSGCQLPVADASFDGVFCSNVLEHVPDPESLTAEIARVVKPGGWVWLAWTNWWSPWGGHNIVPFHLLGPVAGPALWRMVFGEPEKNVPGVGLFPTYVGETLASVRARPDLDFLDALPRYYPSQRWILHVPVLRELATWNCLVFLRRPGAETENPMNREQFAEAPTGTGGRASSSAISAASEVAGVEPRVHGLARSVRDWGRRRLRGAKYYVGDRPALLPLLALMTPDDGSRVVGASTDIVIEGFPRSGNTFAVFALRQAGPDLAIASHIHHPAQVSKAVQASIPTLVVIRRPEQTLASYLVAGPHARPRGVLREYIRYHMAILPFQSRVVVATFDEITTDYARVIDRVNQRFGTEFPLFDQTDANVEHVFAAISRHTADVHPAWIERRMVARPEAARTQARDLAMAQLKRPEHAALLRQATSVYQAVLDA